MASRNAQGWPQRLACAISSKTEGPAFACNGPTNMKPRRFSWDSDTGTHEMELVWVPETTVTPYAFGHGSERRPIHLRGFFIATTPVTQALWTRVMGENPAFHVDPRCP